MYASTTRIVQIMTPVDLDLFNAKVNFGHIGFCILGKSENYVLFQNCCSHSPQSMSIRGQGHYLTLAKGHSDFKKKLGFSRKLLSNFESYSYESLWVNENENLYKRMESHDQDGRHAHIWQKS